MTVVDGAVQKYSGAVTVDSLDIQDATTSVTLDGAVTTQTTLDINSGGTLTQNAKVIAGASLDYDAGGALTINETIAATTVDIDATCKGTSKVYMFRSTGSVLKFPGFRAVYMESLDEEETDDGRQSLPVLEAGDGLSVKGAELKDADADGQAGPVSRQTNYANV